jgi:hypothetical protein
MLWLHISPNNRIPEWNGMESTSLFKKSTGGAATFRTRPFLAYAFPFSVTWSLRLIKYSVIRTVTECENAVRIRPEFPMIYSFIQSYMTHNNVAYGIREGQGCDIFTERIFVVSFTLELSFDCHLFLICLSP